MGTAFSSLVPLSSKTAACRILGISREVLLAGKEGQDLGGPPGEVSARAGKALSRTELVAARCVAGEGDGEVADRVGELH